MLKNISVLIIDDDAWMHKVLSKTIGKLEIADIYSASNGFEGINLSIENSPDVIFLDLLMPELSGATTLRILKSITKTKNIPIIIITSNSDFESLGTVLALGAAEFVAKPFTFSTIQNKLIKVVDSIPHLKSSSKDNFNGFDTEDDDIEFFNSFSNIIENKDKEADKPKPQNNSTRKTYESITNTYTENTKDAIKKILDS